MKIQKQYTHGALTAPAYPKELPANCKWLGGEGYGVWFLLTRERGLAENEYRIRRYADDGMLNCDRIFTLDEGSLFNVKCDFEFGYLSHCHKCTVYQNEEKFEFLFLREYNGQSGQLS